MKQKIALQFMVILALLGETQQASTQEFYDRGTYLKIKNHQKRGAHSMRKYHFEKKVLDDVEDKNQKELAAMNAAIAAEEKAKAVAADLKRRWNEFDGTYHNDDGSQVYPDGSPVSGVNKFLKTSHNKKDDVEDQHEAEMAAAKKEAEANARKALEEAERRKWNEFDGTIHQENGQRMFPDGTTVEGVNYYTKLKNHHKHRLSFVQRMQIPEMDEPTIQEQEARDHEVKAALQQVEVNKQKQAQKQALLDAQERIALRNKQFRQKFNPFDGLFHNEDGSITFLDGREVNGANGFVQRGFKGPEVADRNIVRDEENAAAASALKAKQIADAEYKAATWKRQYNPFDGLVHTDDGKKWTLDGQPVDEDQLQITPQYHDADPVVMEGFKAYDKWVDGLVHHADGSLMDPATGDHIIPPS